MGDYQRAKEYHARNVSREDVKQKVTKSILEEVIATDGTSMLMVRKSRYVKHFISTHWASETMQLKRP